jgi:ribosomal-protein-alanine N-acetyltransferase
LSWQLRRASSDDLDPIMELEVENFPTDAWSRPQMAADLENPDCYYLVAVESSHADGPADTARVIAYAGLMAHVGAGDADIQTIGVASAARRRGLGRVLMQSLIAEARKRRADRVFLEVRVDNESAQTLYRSLGFEEIGLRRNYYKDGTDALTMKHTIAQPRTTVVGVD